MGKKVSYQKYVFVYSVSEKPITKILFAPNRRIAKTQVLRKIGDVSSLISLKSIQLN